MFLMSLVCATHEKFCPILLTGSKNRFLAALFKNPGILNFRDNLIAQML